MKKILSLIITLIATIGVANAQDYMFVTTPGGGVTSFRTEDLAEVQFNKADSWTSLGYCLYGEDFIGSRLTDDGSGIVSGDLCCDYYVEVQENDNQPGIYRLVDPYGPDAYADPSKNMSYANGKITYDTEKAPHWYIEINATDPDCVYIEFQDTGMNFSSFGRIYVYSYVGLYLDEGYSLDEIKAYGWGGTLKDGVITFKYAELISFWPEYSASYQEANVFENFKVDLNDKSDKPGAKNAKMRDTMVTDSSLSVQGNFTDNEIGGELKPYSKTK